MATGLLHYLTTVDTPKAVADDGLENDFAHRVDGTFCHPVLHM